jgi:sugar lactone lactonase YvrE
MLSLFLFVALMLVPPHSCVHGATSVPVVVSTVTVNTYATDLTVDGNGRVLYVSSAFHSVYRLSSTNESALLIAGNVGAAGTDDGHGTAARFSNPTGITCDTSNNIAYISDSYNHRIRSLSLSLTNTVSTLAGSTQGYTDAVGTAAQFSSPLGIAYHKSGALYVGEVDHVRKIAVAAAYVTTLATLHSTLCNYLCFTSNGTFLYVTTDYTVVRINTTEC